MQVSSIGATLTRLWQPLAPRPEAATPATNRDTLLLSERARRPASAAPAGPRWELGDFAAVLDKAKPAPPPAPPAEPAPAPAPAPEPAPAPTYTVQGGDSLSAIAARVLGNGDRWPEIFELNRDQIANPNAIAVGQVLKLPGGASAPAAAPAPAPSSGINTDRDAIFIRQPNGWTCGPTSLTMAAAAWGVRPANGDTINEMVGLTGTSPGTGVPGNASLIARAAEQIGLQANYQGDGSPGNVRRALQEGHGVVLNGSLGTGGHFIYVAGLAEDGRFIIADPWRPEVTRMDDGELDQFANRGPNPRGFAEIWR